MKPEQIYLTRTKPDTAQQPGVLLDDTSYTRILRNSADVYDATTGEALCNFRTGILNPEHCRNAYPALRDAAVATDNRGIALGHVVKSGFEAPGVVAGKGHHAVKKDGTVSKSHRATQSINSGIVGYFDRYVRIPYCRTTAYALNHPDRFLAAMPFVQDISNNFQAIRPDRWQAQHDIIQQTHPDFFISGSVFTTLTVNKNWQTAVHKDAGDYEPGLGVLSVFSAGGYDGCYFVYPCYGLAIDMRTCDLLLGNVHEWHGNSPFHPTGKYERISVVLYYRANMFRCGSAEEELDRAKNRKPGDKLYE